MGEINFGDMMAAEITTPCIVCGESIHIGEYESALVPRMCDKCKDAIMFIKRMRSKATISVVRCKDCDNKECWGRAGDVVCGIDGTPHRPDWFCADGERKSE